MLNEMGVPVPTPVRAPDPRPVGVPVPTPLRAPAPVHVHVIVPVEHRGRLIGKNGQNINRLRKDYNVKINIPRQATKPIKIMGKENDIAKILVILQGDYGAVTLDEIDPEDEPP